MLNDLNMYKCECQNHVQTYKSLQEFLFMCKLFSEIKNYQKIIDKTQNSLYLQLMKLTLQANQSNKSAPKGKKQEHLSLKMSLSCLNYILETLNIFDPAAPLVVQCQDIIYKLLKK